VGKKVLRAKVQNKNRSGKLGVVIVAAGTSQRMVGMNKLFATLRGKPLLAWSVDTCQRYDLVQQIILVLNDKDLTQGQELKGERAWCKVILCPGGARRQDSVKEGLRQMKDCDWVMIHDGARPFLTVNLIEDGLKMVNEFGSAVAAVPVKDTIKLADSRKWIKQTLERNKLWAVQTPQIFNFDIITKAYENLQIEVTDDATAVERLAHEVKLYVGDYRNIKVTTREDLALARIIAREWKQKN
jgi:2-C-methyl-D-erythritol 4-phosphate cytidylyltransferase